MSARRTCASAAESPPRSSLGSRRGGARRSRGPDGDAPKGAGARVVAGEVEVEGWATRRGPVRTRGARVWRARGGVAAGVDQPDGGGCCVPRRRAALRSAVGRRRPGRSRPDRHRLLHRQQSGRTRPERFDLSGPIRPARTASGCPVLAATRSRCARRPPPHVFDRKPGRESGPGTRPMVRRPLGTQPTRGHTDAADRMLWPRARRRREHDRLDRDRRRACHSPRGGAARRPRRTAPQVRLGAPALIGRRARGTSPTTRRRSQPT